ncbi:MAG: HAMP domain-containing histidine kinase [Actinomycetota bacterium]|nr:HAMP domain-containing histidine kinase [Actinomycetota bacterium]
MNRLGSIKVKLGLVILAGVLASDVAALVSVKAGLPLIPSALLAAALALAIVQVVARGLTRPLREMAEGSRAMARGDYSVRVPDADRADEVGELARAFNAMAAELAEVERHRKDLVANVSHELRTPISALQARLENVADGVEPADRETIRTMLAQVERLGRLVAQLLDLSRLESRTVPLDARPFEVGVVLAHVAREARLSAPADVELAVEAPPGLVAHGDAERVHQVVANLVENALRLTPPGGSVRVVAATGRIAVEDTGPGLDADELPRAFERFYLYERYRGHRSVGSGLGLAIVKELTEAMGGSVEVRSGPGAGTAFVVRLPVAAAGDPAQVPEALTPS